MNRLSAVENFPDFPLEIRHKLTEATSLVAPAYLYEFNRQLRHPRFFTRLSFAGLSELNATAHHSSYLG